MVVLINQNQQWAIPKKLPPNNDFNDAVGIDLGTTRCCVAVSRRNGIETIALDNTGERQLPSYIAFDEKHVKCGKIVVSRLRNCANSTVYDVKRIIGRPFNEVVKDSNWPFLVIPDPNNKNDTPCIKTARCGSLVTLKPKEISAALLSYIKEKTEAFQGKPLTSVVITIPASFTKKQNLETYEAAKLAGWKDVTLLPEPIAATFSYFVERPLSNNAIFLLFDLGGGTLDVCIFKVVDDQIEIIASDGDSMLGGRDFDNLLFNHITQVLKDDLKISVTDNKKYSLLKKCQEIKESLSSSEKDILDVSDLDASKEGFIEITRNEFEIMSKDLLNRVKNTIVKAINHTEDLKVDEILFVGGGSRMPMVTKLLKDMFPNATHSHETHPDEAVAKGAAFYAFYLLKGFKKDVQKMIIVETEPYVIPLLKWYDRIAEGTSQRTMTSKMVIYDDGRIDGTTYLRAPAILGFAGLIQVQLFDKDGIVIWKSDWQRFTVNGFQTEDKIEKWEKQIPSEITPLVKRAEIIQKHHSQVN